MDNSKKAKSPVRAESASDQAYFPTSSSADLPGVPRVFRSSSQESLSEAKKRALDTDPHNFEELHRSLDEGIQRMKRY